jgi:large subunit ribosomal protein L4
MELSLHSDAGVINVSDAVFDVKFNETLVHQSVTAYLAAARSGTRAQKSRSDVQGTGAKPWRVRL